LFDTWAMSGEELIGRVGQAFADALGDVEQRARDGALVELARTLCAAIDASERDCPECGSPVAAAELVKLAPQLQAALDALLMTPRSLAAAIGRREGEPGGGRSLKAVRLDEIRAARARERGTTAVDPAAP
jgi:hypothetical protein